MNVGSRVRKLRKELRLTQKQIADKVNVSSQVVSNWERGYTDLSHDDIKLLSDALSCSADYLLGKTDNKNKERNPELANLTEKDKRDIAKRMKKMREEIIEGSKDEEGLSYMGEPMSDEAIESLLEALEHAERIATLANKKYIPNKYKNNE